jgi:hypothetical protein
MYVAGVVENGATVDYGTQTALLAAVAMWPI